MSKIVDEIDNQIMTDVYRKELTKLKAELLTLSKIIRLEHQYGDAEQHAVCSCDGCRIAARYLK